MSKRPTVKTAKGAAARESRQTARGGQERPAFEGQRSRSREVGRGFGKIRTCCEVQDTRTCHQGGEGSRRIGHSKVRKGCDRSFARREQKRRIVASKTANGGERAAPSSKSKTAPRLRLIQRLRSRAHLYRSLKNLGDP